MVHLSTPLVVAVVLSPLGHVPQVLTAPEILMLVTDPSVKRAEKERRVNQRCSRRIGQI